MNFKKVRATVGTTAAPVVSTAGFGTQTYWISLSAPGAPTSTGGVRYLIGKSGHGLHVNRRTASIQLDKSSGLAPANSYQPCNDGVAGKVVELS